MCAQLSARGTLAMTFFKSCIKTAHRLTGHQPCVQTGTLNTGASIGIILRMLGKVSIGFGIEGWKQEHFSH